jgi:hypothetical protein
MVLTGIIFAFTYMHAQYLHCIHPPAPYSASYTLSLTRLPLPLSPTSPPNSIRTCAALLFDFLEEKRKKRKKMTFLPVTKSSYTVSL